MIFAVREKIGKKLVIQFVLLALFVLLTAANLFLSAVSGKSTPSIIIGVNSALIAITVMQVLRLSRTPYRIDVEEDAVSLYGYFSNRRIPYAEISRLETKEFKGLGSVPLQAVCLYNQNNRPVANLPDQYFDFQRLAPEIQAHLRPAETMATTALESASGCFPVRLDTDSAIPEAPPAREFPPGLKVMLWVTLAYALTGILMNTLRLLLVTVALLGGGGTEPDIGASPERQMLAAALLTVLAAMFFGIVLFIGMIGALCRNPDGAGCTGIARVGLYQFPPFRRRSERPYRSSRPRSAGLEHTRDNHLEQHSGNPVLSVLPENGPVCFPLTLSPAFFLKWPPILPLFA